MMYDGWMWGNGWGWAGWVLMGVVMVLFWAAVIRHRHRPCHPLCGRFTQHRQRPSQLWAVASRRRARRTLRSSRGDR